MSARQLPERDYLALKASTRGLLKLAGGQEAASSATRVGQQALSRYGAASEPEAFAPIDVIADLEAETGEPVVTRALAHLAGFDLVSREKGDGQPLPRRLGCIAKEAGDVVASLANALADGTVTHAERVLVEAETQELIAEAHRLLAALKREEGEG